MTKLYYKYLFADNYEAVVTTSEELIPVMSRSFLVEQERVKVWGQPRNDKLFEKINVREQMQKIFQKEKLPEFDSLLLYAPTFRDDGETRLFPFEEFHGENRGRAVEQLQNFLEKNQCIMCIRMHLYEKEGYEWLKALDRPGSRIRFLNEDRIEDIMEVLAMFDLLITDYSSIYIDYLLLERPILFLPYDREAYLKTRGFNFDYDEVTPGPKPKSYAYQVYRKQEGERYKKEKKMRKVITYGTYDLLHYGHVKLLQRAKALGDYLIVALSTDEFNWNEKQKKCYFSYEERKSLLEAIRYVDLVIPEESWEQKISDVKEFKVDTFVIGDDWEGKFDFLKEYCDVVYLPRTPEISTTQIKKDLGKK